MVERKAEQAAAKQLPAFSNRRSSPCLRQLLVRSCCMKRLTVIRRDIPREAQIDQGFKDPPRTQG